MKFESAYLILAASLLIGGVVAQEDSQGPSSLVIVIPVVFGLSLLLSCAMYNSLLSKDQKLPSSKRVMTSVARLLYWLCFCTTGLVGALIFYGCISPEIEANVLAVKMDQADSEVPMEVTESALKRENWGVREVHVAV